MDIIDIIVYIHSGCSYFGELKRNYTESPHLGGINKKISHSKPFFPELIFPGLQNATAFGNVAY